MEKCGLQQAGSFGLKFFRRRPQVELITVLRHKLNLLEKNGFARHHDDTRSVGQCHHGNYRMPCADKYVKYKQRD